jgi:hypothetical protein
MGVGVSGSRGFECKEFEFGVNEPPAIANNRAQTSLLFGPAFAPAPRLLPLGRLRIFEVIEVPAPNGQESSVNKTFTNFSILAGLDDRILRGRHL